MVDLDLLFFLAPFLNQNKQIKHIVDLNKVKVAGQIPD